MIKKMKKMKKRGKLQFVIFCEIFAPLEAKMMKNEKHDKINDECNDNQNV